jgi:epoxyqueuosine reductase
MHEQVLADSALAYVSRYALGRDYHKTFAAGCRNSPTACAGSCGAGARRALCLPRLFRFGAGHGNRVRRQSGIAWRGKHTLSLTRDGSWHFLGEIYTTLPLPPTRRSPITAVTAALPRRLPDRGDRRPYEVDARLCISYLTIELQGAIPVALRR